MPTSTRWAQSRRWWMIAALSLAAACGPTGQVSSPDDSSSPRSADGISPVEEVVDPDTFLDTAEELARQYTTPPGGRVRPELIEPSVLTKDTLESIVAFRVACQWFQHWIDSTAALDVEGLNLPE